MSIPNITPHRATIFLIIIYAVGLVGLSNSSLEMLFRSLTPGNLLLTMAVLFYFHTPFTAKHLVLAVAVMSVGLLAEIFGVNTGLLFGEYKYGNTLGVKIWNTPLMIAVNWLVLSYCAWLIVSDKIQHPLLKILSASALMVLFDVALEPSAIRYDMWTWEVGYVPVHNYIGWFGVSAVIFTMYHYAALPMRNPLKYTVFLIQWVFFIALFFLNILY